MKIQSSFIYPQISNILKIKECTLEPIFQALVHSFGLQKLKTSHANFYHMLCGILSLNQNVYNRNENTRKLSIVQKVSA
eukprot:snap_masked-scaffold_8-processed-gene-6.16-mRNA-1 protein AED:1.00 eAED:1.00 QI:0/0/0/0/1/1/2/0/78